MTNADETKFNEIVNFNSHAHVERDVQTVKHTQYVNISTHTLTWSVTQPIERGEKMGSNFNSHAHVERDNADETKFQEIVNFNSHAHVERDG